jgi:hypothetical protein
MYADGRPLTGYGHRSRSLRAAFVLLAMLLVPLLVPSGAAAQTFKQLVEHPISPRFTVRDSAGHTMDTLKVIDSEQPAPNDRYVGVYHYFVGASFVTAAATSNDLVTWTFRANLATGASQPAIDSFATAAKTKFWVAWEADCARGTCLSVSFYPSFSALVTGQASLSHVIPRTLPGNCNEGTPSFFSPPTRTTLDIGFHYNSTCHTGTDREARGTLTGLGTTWDWSAASTPLVDLMLNAAGGPGNHGDRDRIVFKGQAFRIYEAQLVPAQFESFRPFLYDGSTLTRLNVQTACGATAFANTSISNVTLPSGAPGVFVGHFVFQRGAGSCGSGEMTYFGPVV